MKKALFILTFFIVSAAAVIAQPPPPPPTANESGNGPIGGNSAPIDGGLAISLVMVAGYGSWKMLKALQKRGFQTR
ncbi:MAG: hypothetical protein ACOYNC_07800 [Bacteroidales bacterium]|jgi:hypothetical protein